MLSLNDDELAGLDEFSMLKIYADREHITWNGRQVVERVTVATDAGQELSTIVWGDSDPQFVFLHGAGQNAHTWDTVALKLARPLVAIDLPGHGHSTWRDDRDYSPWANASSIASVIEQVAPNAQAVVGMSLGGLSSIALAATRPELVRALVLVDATPGMGGRAVPERDREAVALVSRPPTFDSFKEMLETTAAAVPGRPIESLIPGVLHSSRRQPDGTWQWRYDRVFDPTEPRRPIADLWDELASVDSQVMLAYGSRSPFVGGDDVEELKRRLPTARIERVEDAGHAVQSDKPLVLAELIEAFSSTPS